MTRIVITDRRSGGGEGCVGVAVGVIGVAMALAWLAEHWVTVLLVVGGIGAIVGAFYWVSKDQKNLEDGSHQAGGMPRLTGPYASDSAQIQQASGMSRETGLLERLQTHEAKALGSSSRWHRAERKLGDAAKDAHAPIRYWSGRIEKNPDDEAAKAQLESTKQLLERIGAALEVASERRKALERFYRKCRRRGEGELEARALRMALAEFDAADDRALPKKTLDEYVGVLVEKMVEARPAEVEALAKLSRSLG